MQPAVSEPDKQNFRPRLCAPSHFTDLLNGALRIIYYSVPRMQSTQIRPAIFQLSATETQ
jgi:hypothetical protein